LKDAKEVLEVLFFYAGIPATAIGSLFKLIKWLGNRKPDSVVIEDNTETIYLSLGDQHFMTNNNTMSYFKILRHVAPEAHWLRPSTEKVLKR
jgi:hypothetical protein